MYLLNFLAFTFACQIHALAQACPTMPCTCPCSNSSLATRYATWKRVKKNRLSLYLFVTTHIISRQHSNGRYQSRNSGFSYIYNEWMEVAILKPKCLVKQWGRCISKIPTSGQGELEVGQPKKNCYVQSYPHFQLHTL